MFKRIFGGFTAVLLALGLTAQTAAARDWYRAESAHFILYSEDSEEATIDYVQDLERLDEVLRLMTGVGADDGSLPPSTKVTVFRYGQTRDMAALAVGNRNAGIGGFFIPRATGAVAFVPRQRNARTGRSRQRDFDTAMQLEPKAVLFHEYVHYFMFQHADAPYPLWYSEGFAELFSNLQFEEDYFIIGEVPTWRSASLATIPLDLEATFDPPAQRDRYTTGRTYAHGWLIASHLNLNPERRGQMTGYMQAIAEGRPIMEAAEIAFGDLDVLYDELEEFRTGRARTLRVPYAVQAEPEVEIRQLNDDEEARMELMIRSKRGVDEDEAERLVGVARNLVAEYPNSTAVLLAALEAEFDARNYDEAESLAQRVLEIDSENTTAAYYYADVALRRSFEDPTQYEVARDRFVDANLMENDHPYPLYGYYLSYLLDPSVDEVPEGAKAALETSFAYAAFDGGVRRALVHMLLLEQRDDAARVVGAEYITGNGIGPCVYRHYFEQYENGDREKLLEEIRPDHPGEYLDEDAREAQRDEFREEAEALGCEVD
ncbi:tetratricopeptide repeat protein [Aurantiacibacter sediminis]|uniref:DUF1570 domain-containing protein n=1 Tax=Aurantiacibacter sediminis TaxID=2793064 RepID=A0ABS0N5E7_9SPHN|nr:hypothetical protein [Aurantiacibacter sediminis]MBH5323006.1 hypothetical protein [Aurantiacibacter sediminis]